VRWLPQERGGSGLGTVRTFMACTAAPTCAPELEGRPRYPLPDRPHAATPRRQSESDRLPASTYQEPSLTIESLEAFSL
jgi:hypothetical protein